MERRQILKAGIAVALSPVARVFAQSAGVQKLADDLYIIRIPGEANVVAHTSADGVTLVDGASAVAADALLKEIAALPGNLGNNGPVQTLVNTHWHPEQTGLNETVGKAGKTILAQENTRLWLGTDVIWPWNGRRFKRLPKIAQPNKTFYTTGELKPGIKYGYIPDAGHTDGDLYVQFEKQNVLAVGDVMYGDGWPVVDYATGGWIGGMVGALQRLQTLCNDNTRIVPARGPVLTRADLKSQYDMYGKIYERLTTLLNRGRGPSEAVAANPTKEFDAKMGNPDEFVRRAFESLWGYLSPDA
jgi:glyoxylase-like metal-dependent hydrolase (beta-lactamase superfamily II)